MSINKGLGILPALRVGCRGGWWDPEWDGGVDHKFGKEASRVPWPAFMAFSVDLEMQ